MARRRRRRGLRITPLGYIVLFLIVAVMLVGVYFIIWSLGSEKRAEGNLGSGAVSVTPTPSLAPTSEVTPTPSLAPTQPPTTAPDTATTAPEGSATTTAPTATDTPLPVVKTPTPSQVQGALDGELMNNGVVLRDGPSGNYTILDKYDSGTKLKIYAAEKDYYFVQVVSDGKYGYMAKKFIQKNGLLAGETATPTPNAPDGAVAGVVTASTVALRNVPSTEGNAPFGQIEKGANVYIYYEMDGFYYIEVVATGTKGYAKASFINPEGDVPKATPKPE